jgi:anti-sigma regulatory factor (Ser/Thr protein kinase)
MSTESSAQLALRAEISELARLHRWLEGLCELHQLPARLAFQLDLCLTELVTNVINYGYPETAAPEEAVAVRFARNPAEVVVEIVDRGVEFDPLGYVPPPKPRTLDEASTGGRGLLLVRQFAGQLRYRREQGQNRLVLIFPAPQRTL